VLKWQDTIINYNMRGEGLQPHASRSETEQAREYVHDHHRRERTTAQHGTALVVPKGPRGERRPADVTGFAVNVAEVATGEFENTRYDQPNKVQAGLAGARSASSRAAAAVR
jgi:hypothetical protein